MAINIFPFPLPLSLAPWNTFGIRNSSHTPVWRRNRIGNV